MRIKKWMLTLLLLSAVWLGNAQNSNPPLLVEARKAFTKYLADPSANRVQLQLAREKIDELFRDKKMDREVRALLLKGDIYYEFFDRELVDKSIYTDRKLSSENFGNQSLTAYLNAYKNSAAGSYDLKDALKRISDGHDRFMTGLSQFYEDSRFEPAYQLGKNLMESFTIRKKNNIKTNLNETETFEALIGVAWFLSQKLERTSMDADFFKGIITENEDTKAGYSILYEIANLKNDPKNAAAWARLGHEKYPDDVAILFNLINALVQQKDYDAMVPALKKGIAQEPGNSGLYFALGQAYDALYQQAATGGNQDKANGYFKEAVNYYTQAVNKNRNSIDPLYSLGALYYNQASLLQASGDKLTGPDAEEKRKKLASQILALFDQALPWFQKVEALDPNDLNTLIGLINIYTWKGDVLAAEFKKRADKVQAGGRNTGSYFKK